MPESGPPGLLTELRREVDRSFLRARNGIRHVAGVAPAATALSPKEVVWQRGKAQLWHYQSPGVTRRPPVVIVMSLISRSYILDLRPGNSFVEQLLRRGFDVFMVDWGVPDAADARNRLETYVDGYLPDAIEAACTEAEATDITMLGYCLGGVLALLYATRPQSRLRNLVVMAAPVDTDQLGVIGRLARAGRIDAEHMLGPDGNVPAGAIRRLFKLQRPTAEVVKYVNLWENLWNDEYVEVYQAMNRWANDHVPFPGAAAGQVVQMLVRENRLASGTFRLGRRTARLAAITCPFLNVMAERDDIVPPAAAAPATALIGSRDRRDLRIPAGHVALVAGRTAVRTNIPHIADWIDAHSDPAGAQL